MTAEQELRSIAERLARYRFKDADHLIDFVDELRRDVLTMANAAGKCGGLATPPPERLDIRSGRVMTTTIEVSGRRVTVQKRAAFGLR